MGLFQACTPSLKSPLKMADDYWQKVREIFDAALRRQPDERRGFVRKACGDDEALLVEVGSLLSSLENAGSFLETPAVAGAAGAILGNGKRLEKGERVEHYEIVEQIGEGGMGEVYLARDTRLNRKVALKLLSAHITEDKNRVSRFRQEAFATSALNHPNILTIYEIGEWCGRDFIAAEFVNGTTLRNLLKKRKLSIDSALDIALQIASALAATHTAGVIHRDIKPENIMIRPDGLVKILDFGIAKYRPTETGRKALVETEAGEVIGTVAYMSPEQARGLEIDSQSDIWSLGVILYEMIARKMPFPGKTKSDRLAAILEHEPVALTKNGRTVHPQLQLILDRALAKDKKQRYAKMKDLAEDLRQLRETTSCKSPSPFILSVQTPTASRRAYLLAGSAIVSLITVIAFSYYFYAAKNTTVGNKRSIAVMPLKPINTADRDELYEIGIADSLIHRLSSMKGFVVRPLSATRNYAGIEQDAIAAGREQQVDYILSSNYQLVSGKIRVTSQLFNVANGHVEETYKSEKDAGDIFAMQDAIAGEVGDLLLARFETSSSPTAKRGTTNEEAYRLYLQGMYLVDKENQTDSKRAIELFDKALSLDPDYAKAWAGKARAHCSFAHWGGSSPAAEFANARPALERALALNANLAEVYGVLGIIRADYDWDFGDAEKHFLRAIELAPDSDNLNRWYANRLSGQGRSEEAIARIKTAIDLNPNSVFHQIMYGRILYFARRYDDALTQLRWVVEMDSANPFVYHFLWRSYHMKGDFPRAYESFIRFQQLIGTNDETLKGYETSYAKNGWQSVLLRYLEILKANNASGSRAYGIAELSALLGQREQAFRYLDDAVKNRSLEISNILGDPSLDSLRDEQRYDELVRRIESK
jgi:eukaryotic-like serine/threonine-protein kinase